MMRNLALSFVALVGLSGCVSLLPNSGGPSPRISLDAGSVAGATTPSRHDLTLVVNDPSTAAAFNTFSVAVATAPLEYQYLADAEWTDRVPVLVRRFMEQRFEVANVFAAVGDRTAIARPDYTLQTDIRSFHLDRQGSQPVATVALAARLVDRRGRVIASQIFSAQENAPSTARSGRASAFNIAARAVADDIIDWADQAVTADQADAS